MPFQFFFSYARDDSGSDRRLIKFFTDLENAVRDKTGIPKEKIGFRDSNNIETGDDWSTEMKDALQTSQVLVCLSSPTYINRDFCGKEFGVFHDRLGLLKLVMAPTKPRRVILPVVWIPVKGEMPGILNAFQLHDEDLPKAYREEGLQYLMKLRKFRDQYQEFLDAFAQKVVEAAQGASLPPLGTLPDFTVMRNAFNAMAPGGSPAAAATNSGGPNNATFVFVAAKQTEMLGYKSSITHYDDRGGWFLRPFQPATDEFVGIIAQEVASKEQLRFGEMLLGPDILTHLQNAFDRNEIVIIIVDAWTLNLPEYKRLMRLYDGSSFINTALLVPWNDQDGDTVQHQTVLEDMLKVTFKAKFAVKHPIYFNDSVRSHDNLRVGMQGMLAEIKMKIIEVSEAEKRIAHQPLPKPSIPVPNGDIR